MSVPLSIEETKAAESFFGCDFALYMDCHLMVVREVPRIKREVEGGVMAKDYPALRRFAHEYSSVFMTLGWNREHDLVAELHRLIHENEPSADRLILISRNLGGMLNARCLVSTD